MTLNVTIKTFDMLKLNKFTNFIVDGDNTILFNLQTEAFIVLNHALSEIVNAHKDNVKELEDKHAALFQQMKEKGFIISSDVDEVADMIDKWKENDNDPSFFSMIINPTLGCNLRCWYCYEDHERKPIMKADVISAVCRLIEKKTALPGMRSLNVSFFGGEPLLGFDKVVMPILTFAASKCKERGLLLNSNFTTNGVLLTADVLTRLDEVGLSSPATFQISLDGNRDYHDRSRIGANQSPTYDTIVKNIIEAVKRHHTVSVRLNYTAGNAQTFVDVLDDFSNLPEECKKFVIFNFQQIWQDQANDIHERIDELKDHFRSEHFAVESDHISHRQSCYADKENNVVINSDGNVFKCTARDFIPQNREGRLTEDGDIVWNERFEKRMAVKYSNTACLNCKVLPICNGGCSQGKLEAQQHDKCYRNMDEQAKDDLVIRCLKERILEQANK